VQVVSDDDDSEEAALPPPPSPLPTATKHDDLLRLDQQTEALRFLQVTTVRPVN